MVLIIRKSDLPRFDEVTEPLREAATVARQMTLREPRPAGFPLLFTSELQLIEPALGFLHEHAIQRAHTADTLRTYSEILYDWFDTLEQNGIAWGEADAVDLVAYRNRMLGQPSARTGRAYSVRTINHRVHGVLRFYEWAVRHAWLRTSPLVGQANDFVLARRDHSRRRSFRNDSDRSLFVLRQFESLPRPLTSSQARELLAKLVPPYDLMARWQLYTGLRVSELLRLTIHGIRKTVGRSAASSKHRHYVVDVLRKGRKSGYVIASESLMEETNGYLALHRKAWMRRAARKRGVSGHEALFINVRGTAAKKNTYQQIIGAAGNDLGFRATTHLLRATFACMMLSRLEQLAKQGAAINPLLIVKVLMGHEHIETTDRYLRAIATDQCVLPEVLDSLLT
jgi:site-specific recombinase XerD